MDIEIRKIGFVNWWGAKWAPLAHGLDTDGGLGGTTGSASDSRSEGRGFDSPLTQCVSQLSGKPPGVNCRLWPATTPSSEL